MAQIAFLGSPRDLVVMAGTAEFSIPDFCHGYITATRAHLESDFSVAYVARVADTMKPVWEDHWAHTGFFRSLVDYHISVFGTRGW